MSKSILDFIKSDDIESLEIFVQLKCDINENTVCCPTTIQIEKIIIQMGFVL